MDASVMSVSVGPIRETERGVRTAIDKRCVAGRVRAHVLGLDGDEQADRRHHGGVDQAVYAFQREDLDRWAQELARPLGDGAFGENLTTRGIDLAAALIGERWRIGEAVFEVSAPRIPCRTFADHLGEAGWVRRFTEEGRSGAYLRVLVEGTVGAGDAIVVLDRPDHDVSTAVVFRALSTQRELLPRLLSAPQLPAKILADARAYGEAGGGNGAHPV